LENEKKLQTSTLETELHEGNQKLSKMRNARALEQRRNRVLSALKEAQA